MQNLKNNKADVLLQHTQRYEAGRLTIFLGAAPGVGKTYAMLVRAHDLALQGVDIVIAYVETHARIETENLIQGLKIIPRKPIEYKNRFLEEMDLDAILQLKPSIALVDELAHSNIPNSRHTKRWQDINELLDAGIDVFTTMNIQHLESLNDVIYQITGIRVSETVPDQVFERIRDIRLIDLPIDELLERLNQGKVYVPEQAQQAIHQFFNYTNLTALRELAMQTVASHVDSDVRENFTIHGLKPIPLKNHILIMIEGNEYAEALIRAGCRIAEHRMTNWTAVSFSHQSHIKTQQRNIQNFEIEGAMSLARQLGGMTEIIYGQKRVKALFEYAIDRGISTLVIGQNKRTFFSVFKTDLIRQLLKYQPNFELSIVPITSAPSYSNILDFNFSFLSFRELLLLLLTTTISIMISSLGEAYLGVEELSVIFITAVVFIASKTRMQVAVLSAILFFLAYSYFFIPPKFTFQISAEKGVITVGAFLLAALISSRLASRLKEQLTALKVANSYNSTMQDLGQKLSTALDLVQILEISKIHFCKYLNAEIWFYFPDQVEISNQAIQLNEKDKISADWTFKNHQASGRFTQTLMKSEYWFIPLLAMKQCLGVFGIKFSKNQTILSTEQRQLADSMIEYVSQAISRTQLTKALEIANINSETERLRSALLSSVSHDLRTPLASIIGSADTLMHYRHSMSEQDQNNLLKAIHLESERLERYIQNLLDMTRLGHEGLSLKRDWIGVEELIGSAIRRLKRYLPKALVDVHLSDNSISLFVHAALVEQAIFNVLENAAKFSPQDKPIVIEVLELDGKKVEIAISDQGQGIPEDERERIFDMFYTMSRGDRGQYGTGLGLTIVKAIIGAHMGKISASTAKNNQGTCIRIQLPIQQLA